MKVTYIQEEESQANWKGISEHPGWFRRSSVTREDTKTFPVHIHLLICTTRWMGDVTGEKATKAKNCKIKFSCIKVDQGG